jgi:predicted phosphodiesterase
VEKHHSNPWRACKHLPNGINNVNNLGDISAASRLLVFGGCYSNLAATQAMQAVARQLDIKPQQVICTGDLIAYCAEPVEVIDLIQGWGIHVLMGNCEESLGFERLDCGCGFEQSSACSTLSIAWYRYALQRVTPENRAWMKSLPRLIEFQFQSFRFSVVHGSVTSINQFIFPSTELKTKLAQINQGDTDVVIGGHSGIPFGQSVVAETLKSKVWLNSGVIGMPANDGTADGWYMLIEAVNSAAYSTGNSGYQVSWHRLVYDAKTSQETTHKAGMVEYSEALTSGLWPSMDILPTVEREAQGQRLSIKPMTISDLSLRD